MEPELKKMNRWKNKVLFGNDGLSEAVKSSRDFNFVASFDKRNEWFDRLRFIKNHEKKLYNN